MAKYFLGFIFSILLMAAGRWNAEARYEWKYPTPDKLIITQSYKQDLTALIFGARRVAADLAYIQFLQYYGVADPSENERTPPFLDFEPLRLDNQLGRRLIRPQKRKIYSSLDEGIYPRLFEIGKRMLMLDPFFHAAFIEIGGSLAFNLERPDEAANLLTEASRLDPLFHRYRLYLASILYKNEGKDEELLNILDQAIQYPDCPNLLENILANLHKKYGNIQKAALVYYHIIETAPNEGHRTQASASLRELMQDHPILREKISPLFNE